MPYSFRVARRDVQRHGALRVLSATAELLVYIGFHAAFRGDQSERGP